jgi:hypothetical protein
MKVFKCVFANCDGQFELFSASDVPAGEKPVCAMCGNAMEEVTAAVRTLTCTASSFDLLPSARVLQTAISCPRRGVLSGSVPLHKLLQPDHAFARRPCGDSAYWSKGVCRWFHTPGHRRYFCNCPYAAFFLLPALWAGLVTNGRIFGRYTFFASSARPAPLSIEMDYSLENCERPRSAPSMNPSLAVD